MSKLLVVLAITLAGCSQTPQSKSNLKLVTKCEEFPKLASGSGATLLPWIVQVKSQYLDCKAKVDSLITE